MGQALELVIAWPLTRRWRASYGIYAYIGREWDPELGLYYYRARYYDPRVGQFSGDDPIGCRGPGGGDGNRRSSPGMNDNLKEQTAVLGNGHGPDRRGSVFWAAARTAAQLEQGMRSWTRKNPASERTVMSAFSP